MIGGCGSPCRKSRGATWKGHVRFARLRKRTSRSATECGPYLHRRTPAQNHVLTALPRHDYERLVPDLEPFPLPLGWTVHDAGDREKYLYFLTAGIVSRFYVTESGASAEFAVTRNEGVIGIASFLGGDSTPSQAVVLSAGDSYRLAAGRLRHEFEHDRTTGKWKALLGSLPGGSTRSRSKANPGRDRMHRGIAHMRHVLGRTCDGADGVRREDPG